MNAIITFQDHGQDFLIWRIENDKVVDSQPFQFRQWGGAKILNGESLKVGACVEIHAPRPINQFISIKYPIESIQVLPDAFGYEVEILLNAGGAETETITKRWQVKSYAAACKNGRLVKRAKRITKVTPVSKEAWISAYGDSRLKNPFK